MTERVNEDGEVLQTKELHLHLGSCGFSLDRPECKNYDPAINNGEPDDHYHTVDGNWGKPESEVLTYMFKNKLQKDLNWYLEKRQTEKFIRYVGKVITMGKYQIFNPLTGTHTLCETEAEAKTLMADIANQIIERYPISVCRELSNELGHTTWIAEEIQNPFTISPNV
jgi:hypothetical protein